MSTVTKTRDAATCGVYRSTSHDACKAAADFRWTAVGRTNCIVWRDGRYERVTAQRLAELQATYTWVTDF